jgi:hypothetical protein
LEYVETYVKDSKEETSQLKSVISGLNREISKLNKENSQLRFEVETTSNEHIYLFPIATKTYISEETTEELHEVQVDKPGETLKTAIIVAPNQKQNGLLSENDICDYYKLEIGKPGRLTIIFNSWANKMDIALFLEDEYTKIGSLSYSSSSIS